MENASELLFAVMAVFVGCYSVILHMDISFFISPISCVIAVNSALHRDALRPNAKHSNQQLDV